MFNIPFAKSAAAGAIAVVALSSTSASALTISFDFESLAIGALPGDTLTLTQGAYTATFSGAGLQIRSLGGAFDADSGKTRYLSTTFDLEEITVDLSGPQSIISATILNPIYGGVTSEVDEIVATAFDASSAIIGGPVQSTAKFITVAAPGISKLTYDDVNDSTGYVIGELEVEAVPVPAAAPLLAGAIGALGFMGARRKRKAQA